MPAVHVPAGAAQPEKQKSTPQTNGRGHRGIGEKLGERVNAIGRTINQTLGHVEPRAINGHAIDCPIGSTSTPA
eukprot:1639097-Lingulodinium_polyedra.AAC.1